VLTIAISPPEDGSLSSEINFREELEEVGSFDFQEASPPPDLASYPGPSHKARRGPGTHYVRMRVISPVLGGFVILMDIYSTYTNRVHIDINLTVP